MFTGEYYLAMSLEELINKNLGIHEHICTLVGLRRVFDNKQIPKWIIFLYASSSVEILILLRQMLSKGKNSDDVCIQKLLYEMQKDKDSLLSKSEYHQKIDKLKELQEIYEKEKISFFVSKFIAHVTKDNEVLSRKEQKKIDELIEKVSDFLEEEIWPYSDLKNKKNFQARIALYEERWKETERLLLDKEIINEI